MFGWLGQAGKCKESTESDDSTAAKKFTTSSLNQIIKQGFLKIFLVFWAIMWYLII
jgi:hypothetical protein